MLQFYIAASYPRKLEMRRYAKAINDSGYGICNSSRVFSTEQTRDMTEPEDLRFGGVGYGFARKDVEDIVAADALIFFSSTYDGAPYNPGRGGRHTEFGISWLSGKPIYVMGARENVFHAMVPDYAHYTSFADFINKLDKVKIDIEGRRTLAKEIVINAIHDIIKQY